MENQQTQDTVAGKETDTVSKQKRNRLLLLLAIVVTLAGMGSYLYWKLIASKHITTNNAYAAADIAHVTTATSGLVKDILVVDTQSVKADEVLLTLDDSDAQLALKQAQANFMRAEANLEQSKENFERRSQLIEDGFVSNEELSRVESAYKIAQANMSAAKIELDKAQIELDRTVIKSPIEGIVAKREVQLGQRVAAGSYLLSVVPINDIYINANFKEVQLQKVKIGQSVTAHADLYGSRVSYHGKVVGLSGGTGAAFAIIPAQNATGNWIKVVQRLPVRIELDVEDLVSHPLKVGLSMDVDVDISEQGSV